MMDPAGGPAADEGGPRLITGVGQTRGVPARRAIALTRALVLAVGLCALATGCPPKKPPPPNNSSIREQLRASDAELAAAAARRPNPAADQEWGRWAEGRHRAMRAAGVLVTEGTAAQYLGLLADRMTQAAGSAGVGGVGVIPGDRFQFHLVRADLPLAFTTGGPHVYVSTALLAKCKDENDLAATLAHQAAHVLRRDFAAPQRAVYPPLPELDRRADPQDRLMHRMGARGYDEAQEIHALELAGRLYLYGGWDPARFDDLADRLVWPEGPVPEKNTSMRTAPRVDRGTFEKIRNGAATATTASSAGQRPVALAVSEHLLVLPRCIFNQAFKAAQAAAAAAIRERVTPPPPMPETNPEDIAT